MNFILKLTAFMVCLGAALFYCSISHAHIRWQACDLNLAAELFTSITGHLSSSNAPCYNQALSEDDTCDVYVITD